MGKARIHFHGVFEVQWLIVGHSWRYCDTTPILEWSSASTCNAYSRYIWLHMFPPEKTNWGQLREVSVRTRARLRNDAQCPNRIEGGNRFPVDSQIATVNKLTVNSRYVTYWEIQHPFKERNGVNLDRHLHHPTSHYIRRVYLRNPTSLRQNIINCYSNDSKEHVIGFTFTSYSIWWS